MKVAHFSFSILSLLIALAIKFDLTFAICGDCVTDFTLGETCDDCNTNNGDGYYNSNLVIRFDRCSSTCKMEKGYFCYVSATSSKCAEICGDGINVNNTFPCDDGNRLSKDGCSSTC